MLALLLLASLPIGPTAASWGDHLLVADGDGTVRAWNAKELTFDPLLTKKLNGDGLLAVVRSGETLWGFDGARVFTWDDAGARWDAPDFDDQVKGRGFSDSPVVASHGTQLAIGTGFGEWGGHLWLLDVTNGAWRKHYDGLGNAVGVAWSGDTWAVAWSMSHMSAHTRVRLHDRDAKSVKEGKQLRGQYLRKLAFDEETKTLFGLEQNELVRVDAQLALSKVQDVGKLKYGPEANAVGVSSGISTVLALGGGRFLIAPFSGEPVVVGGGKVTALSAPRVDAGPAKK